NYAGMRDRLRAGDNHEPAVVPLVADLPAKEIISDDLPGATQRLGAMMTHRSLSATQPWMRADTHHGPEYNRSIQTPNTLMQLSRRWSGHRGTDFCRLYISILPRTCADRLGSTRSTRIPDRVRDPLRFIEICRTLSGRGPRGRAAICKGD